MKEFQTKAGGRYMFNEDFENLQELVESSHSIFKDCEGNFVVWGVNYNSSTHIFSSGIVWLGGKLRTLPSTQLQQNYSAYYIVPFDYEVKELYEDGNEDIMAIEYEARIVTQKPTSGDYIESDSIGRFNDSKKMFWGHYAFSKYFKPKTSGGLQYIAGEVGFNGNVSLTFARNGQMKIWESGRCSPNYGSLAISNVSSRQNMNPNIRRPMLLLRKDGTIVETLCNGNGGYAPFNESDNKVYGTEASGPTMYFDNVVAKRLIGGFGSSLNAKSIFINGQNILDRYYTIEEWGDTGWLPIIDTSNNRPLNNLFARKIHSNVYIQGTLPSDFFARSLSQYGFEHITHYKLPDEIPMPGEREPSAIYDFCHLHTIAYCSIRLQGQSRDEQYTMGCAVMISANQNNRGTFVVRQNMNNGRSDTFYDNSFPTFDFLRFTPLAFPEGINPNVSWRYAVDAPLSAQLVQHVSGKDIAYNPESHVIHCYAFLQTIYDNSSSYVTYYNVTSIAYTTDAYTQEKDWNDQIDWHQIPINKVGDKDVRVMRYRSGSWIWTEDDAMCAGYYFNTFDYIPSDTKCTIKVCFENADEIVYDLIEYPQTYSINLLVSRSDSMPDRNRYIIPNDGRHQIIRPSILCWHYYYYERFNLNGQSYSINDGQEADELFEIVVGSEYIRKVNGRWEWTNAALTATSSFIVSVKRTITIDGRTFEKFDSETIDPSEYKLSNNDNFVQYY